MFPKKNRLSNREFDHVFRHGDFLGSKSFYLRFLKGKEMQFAVSAPKKIFKKSVERNRVRRRAYAFLRMAKKELKSQQNIILVAKENFISDNMESLLLEITKCLRKIDSESFA